jgi:hypothetical protein
MEAMNYVAGLSVGNPHLVLAPGTYTLQAPVKVINVALWFEGSGIGVTSIACQLGFSSYFTDNAAIVNFGNDIRQKFSNFSVNAANCGGVPGAFHLQASGLQFVDNVEVYNGTNGFYLEQVGSSVFSHILVADVPPATDVFYLTAHSNVPCTDVTISDSTIFTSGAHAVEIDACDGCIISRNQGSGGANGWFMAHVGGGTAATGHYISSVTFAENLLDVSGTQFSIRIDGNTLSAGSGGGPMGGFNITGNMFVTCGGSCTSIPQNILLNANNNPPYAINIVGNVFGNAGGPNININGAVNRVLISGNNMDCTPGTNLGCVEANNAVNLSILSNKITDDTNGFAIALEGGSQGAVNIQGNDLGESIAPLTLDSGFAVFPSSAIVTGNKGIDEVIPTLTPGATFTIPFNPVFVISNNPTITAIATGAVKGSHGQLVTTNASGATFTAGASIGNTCTTSQNKMYSWMFDGTKFWINGPGC